MVLIPRTSPRHSFGTGLRDAREQGGARGRWADGPTPGPGHYGEQSPPLSSRARSTAAVFGTSERRGAGQRLCPGPGSYAAKTLQTGPGYPFRPSELERLPPAAGPGAASPGPGAHGVLHGEMNGPKYSMGQGRQTKEVVPHPGPGHYSAGSVSAAATPRRRAQRGFGFGTSVREPGSPHPLPGPGQYSVDRSLGGKEYSLLPRRANPAADSCSSPGPGAHNVRSGFGE
mmetsp:Transcript_24542/g.76351  ORF Transcript_24542/g.76351 Transcript_24542/m.76351 type:complete len:229 (-) Transcript_24542:58-744(-)